MERIHTLFSCKKIQPIARALVCSKMGGKEIWFLKMSNITKCQIKIYDVELSIGYLF